MYGVPLSGYFEIAEYPSTFQNIYGNCGILTAILEYWHRNCWILTDIVDYLQKVVEYWRYYRISMEFPDILWHCFQSIILSEEEGIQMILTLAFLYNPASIQLVTIYIYIIYSVDVVEYRSFIPTHTGTVLWGELAT